MATTDRSTVVGERLVTGQWMHSTRLFATILVDETTSRESDDKLEQGK